MQAEIAELTQKNAGYTSALCYDKQEPRGNNNGYPETEKIILIAKLFQVSLDELLIVGINELQFAVWISRNWQTMYLLDSIKMRWDDVIYMVMTGVCVFVMVFCAGVYWSYAVLLRGDSLQGGA